MKNKLKLNTVLSVVSQIITMICGFILPRIILSTYGSDENGILSSVTQFLSFISLLDLGVGAVIQTAYYKPLSEGDSRLVSLTFNEANKFFKRIAYILIVYVFVLIGLFIFLEGESFSPFYIAGLVISISISMFAQYYISAPYSLLLNADQKYYISALLSIVCVILNTLFSFGLIKIGAALPLVKLTSSMIFLIQPIMLSVYVKKYYSIDKKETDPSFKIDQKWNGMAQHCATVIMNNTDVMILTLFSTLSNVSVYYINMHVVSCIKAFINSLSNGYSSLMGDLFVKHKQKELNSQFDNFEWIVNNFSVLIFSVTLVLICPFISIYTRGITDAQYIQPLFSTLLIAGQFVFCLRIPYNTIICSAGHYRQTQISAVVEAIINITISIALVYKWGLIGVAIGTLVAVTYRTLYFVVYINKNIINRSIAKFIKQLLIDLLCISLIVAIGNFICKWLNPSVNYINWVFAGALLFTVSLLIIGIINVIFYSNKMKTIRTILNK